MHKFLIKHVLQSKIILSFDSKRNKMQSNLQSYSAIIIAMGPGANVIKLLRRKLRIFIISWSVCSWQAFPG
jgi:hypothetical protein